MIYYIKMAAVMYEDCKISENLDKPHSPWSKNPYSIKLLTNVQ
jgi:hypothetical protein